MLQVGDFEALDLPNTEAEGKTLKKALFSKSSKLNGDILHCPHSHRSHRCPLGLWLRSQKIFSGPEAARTPGRWLLEWAVFPSSLGAIPSRTLFGPSSHLRAHLLLSKYLQNSGCHPRVKTVWISFKNRSGELFSQLESVVNTMNVQFLREHHKSQGRGTPQPLSGLFGRDVLDTLCLQMITAPWGHWTEHFGAGGSSNDQREPDCFPEKREGETGWVQMRIGRMLQEHWM